MANAQLHLLPTGRDWKIDEDTKRIGRAGLAAARASLAQAVPVVSEIGHLVEEHLVEELELQPAA